MKTKLKAIRWQSFCKYLAVFWMALAIAWTLTAKAVAPTAFSLHEPPLTQGFSQALVGQTVALADVTQAQMGPVGAPLILLYEVPELTDDMVFFFYTKDVEVNIIHSDTSCYQFAMEEPFTFLRTPGNKWHSVDIPKEWSGDTLCIKLLSQFANRYPSTLRQCYLIHPSATLRVALQQEGFRIAASFVLFFMAGVAYLNAFIWQRHVTRIYFFHLGHLYLCTALWLCAMYGGFSYIFQKPIFSYLISLCMAVFLPVVVYEFATVIYTAHDWLIHALGWIMWGNFILQMVLQFVFGISLLTLLPLTELVFVIGAIGCICLIARHIHSCWGHLEFSLVSLCVVLVGALGEIAVLRMLPDRTDLIGVSAVAGLVVYLVVNHVYLLKQGSNIDLQKLRLEQNYNELQNTTLMQQIKAHFFFNILNTISGLCKSDPVKADYAILTFAKYMRSYMGLINERKNIPFVQELSMIDATLTIEQLRFPDTFSYEISLDVTDFLLPPLSIQPIVENAIIHGLRKDTIFKSEHGGGKIQVKTRQCADGVQIIVQDNGVGFNTEILKTSPSIGLKNLEKRVQLMANGTVLIQSKPNVGTCVTLTIPSAQV